MTHFSQIQFEQVTTRRRKTLAEVMPKGDEWHFFVVLSDGYVSTGGGEVHIRNFTDLQRAMSLCDSLQALLAARASGNLTEGRHELPDVIATCLTAFNAEPSSIRRWRYGASEPSTVAVPSSELGGVWPGSDFEEIEVVDASASWYFRMKDDDALIFLAVRDPYLLVQIRRCETYCVEVGKEFEYAQ